MNFKKYISIILVLVMTVFLFAGCMHGKPNTENKVEEKVVNADEVIGCWKSEHEDGLYLGLFEDGEGFLVFGSGSAQMFSYEIENDIITLHPEKAELNDLHLTNVFIDGSNMNCIIKGEGEINFTRITKEEMTDIIENM